MAINLTNFTNRSKQIEHARAAQQKSKVEDTNVAGASVQSPPKMVQSDSVSITPQAKSLTAMEHDLALGTPVNESKVASLKKAIAEGSYQVDANKLAKNITDLESLLG